MTRALLYLTLALGGCCTAPPITLAPPDPPPAEPPASAGSSMGVAPATKPAIAVVEAYRQARDRELPAITRPDVSPEYITNIHQLEITARRTVRTLINELDRHHKPSDASLDAARRAVHALDAALEAPA